MQWILKWWRNNSCVKTTEKEKSLGTFPPVSLIYGVLLIPLNRQFAKHKFQIQIVKPATWGKLRFKGQKWAGEWLCCTNREKKQGKQRTFVKLKALRMLLKERNLYWSNPLSFSTCLTKSCPQQRKKILLLHLFYLKSPLDTFTSLTQSNKV